MLQVHLLFSSRTSRRYVTRADKAGNGARATLCPARGKYFAYEVALLAVGSSECVQVEGPSVVVTRAGYHRAVFTSDMYNTYVYLRTDKSWMTINPGSALLSNEGVVESRLPVAAANVRVGLGVKFMYGR